MVDKRRRGSDKNFMQGFGRNQKASKMKAWLQFHPAGRELVSKEKNSTTQTATRNSSVHVGL